MSLRMFNHAKRKEPDEVVDLLRNVSLSPSKKVRASTVRVASSFSLLSVSLRPVFVALALIILLTPSFKPLRGVACVEFGGRGLGGVVVVL